MYKSERDNKPKKEHLEKLKLYLKKIDELCIDKRTKRDKLQE